MSRYIDADGLLAKVPQASADIFENCRNCTCLDSEQIKELIDAEPTADVAEVKRGRWEYKARIEQLYDFMGVKTWGVAWQCSECGFIHTRIENHGRYFVCPNCGAKMDEVEE